MEEGAGVQKRIDRGASRTARTLYNRRFHQSRSIVDLRDSRAR